MNSTVKTVLFWLLIGVSALLLWEVVKGARDGQKDKEVNFSQFMTEVDRATYTTSSSMGCKCKGKYKDGTAFHTTAPVELSRHD